MIVSAMETAVTSLMAEILQLPFNQQLATGELPQSQFTYYLRQDQLFLGQMGRALATIAGRTGNNNHAQQLLHFAAATLQEEQKMQDQYLATLPSDANKQPMPMNIANFSYCNYLLKAAAFDTVAVAAAAAFSCPWVYYKVGLELAKITTPANPYQQWIELYSGDSFATAVASWELIIEEMAAAESTYGKQQMITAFVNATKLEKMFWQEAVRY